ncbi:MAG: DNA polymerase/3'-5' exonuclease PolX, partial [Taibaiella sp.]|nr:DNA polymerase/3'-5' exonuclease PolX [Taibaiella sp.]
VHSNLRMSPEKACERVLKALDNPYVRILGHPTGRLLLSREGYPVDIKAVIDKCAERNIVIELNTNPRRLDIDWSWVNYAISKGVLLSLNPDAHSVEGIDHIEYGILSAQKSMLTKENNLSSFSLPEIQQYLGV